ncbi:hypothetical protein NSP_32930 [Nodularia spumigena CCY9414]|nr:hypothetical protein NSP_32930 [Nodularia spumigena CCY9414]
MINGSSDFIKVIIFTINLPDHQNLGKLISNIYSNKIEIL